MHVDPKELTEDLHKLEFADGRKPGNEFILTRPLWDKPLYRNKKTYEAYEAGSPCFIDGNKAAHTRYTKLEKADRLRQYRL